MSIYLAGPWSRRAVAADVAAILVARGLAVASSWHDGPDAEEPTDRWELQRIVARNRRDMSDARRVVVLALEGGCETWVELGWRLHESECRSGDVPVVVALGARLPASAGARCHVVTPPGRSIEAIADVVVQALAEVG